MDSYDWVLIAKTVHIVGFVSWFAMLFYIVRLFVYHIEADGKDGAEILKREYERIEQRLYKAIGNPAMMITWTAGIAMLVLEPAYLKMGWLHLKLFLVVLLTGYHMMCKGFMKKLKAGTLNKSSFWLRNFNEVATVFLMTIAMLAVFGKAQNLNYLIGFGVVAALSILIFFMVYRVNKKSK